jgi:hypothetical protein
MIGVEELELNLSPHAQRTMFHTIRELVRDRLITQALLTSHSPYSADENDVTYYQVRYDDAGRATVVSVADKAAREAFFTTGTGWEPDDF